MSIAVYEECMPLRNDLCIALCLLNLGNAK